MTIKLNIADIIIELQSTFRLRPYTQEEQKIRLDQRLNNFFYHGRKKAHIRIKVKLTDNLPEIRKVKHLFTTYHFQDGKANWSLFRKDNTYIYKCPLKSKKQLVLVNETFNKATAYLLTKKKNRKLWQPEDVVYDFLQVLLINYLAQYKKGIFVHSIGVRDLDGKGLLFAGKSGCGKTTTAELWHRHSRAVVLNDDRIIVRKLKAKFFIYSSPWHGDFSDYLYSRRGSAPLDKLFFIHHFRLNRGKRVFRKEAFSQLYTAVFPTFWDKEYLKNIVYFCFDLVKNTACYKLGFINNKKVIGFVREVR